MHHIHMSHAIHIKPCKIKLCIESHSTRLSDHVRNIMRYAHGGPITFGNHRSHLHSDHAEFSDLTNLIDHCESDSDLRFTINPDGGHRPVEVGCVMTSSIPIDRKHSLIDP